MWGVGQRVAGCTVAEVNAAVAKGEILRTHVLRPTWHLVAPEDIRWLLAVTGPRIIAASAGRYRRLGLDERLLARSSSVIASALGGGDHLTRPELGAALATAGIDATRDNGLAHIVMRAELDAIVCSGAPRGVHQTYALLDERVPDSLVLSGDEALVELTRRYFTSHGPALTEDFAWWAGLTLTAARRGIELIGQGLAAEMIDGKRFYFSPDADASRADRPVVRLLPNFDEYIVSYRDRTHAFDAGVIKDKRFLRDYLSTHLVVVDGRAVGRWRRTLTSTTVTIDLEPALQLEEDVRDALASELDRYARFLGVDAVVRQPS
jgi:Winged helix DNA-binding domain